MGIFGASKRDIEAAVATALEKRANIENPGVPISGANVIELLGWDWGKAASGERVTIESALGVPAIWAAVNFLSGTLASLPLHLYRKTPTGPERVNSGLATILHDAVNDEVSSFDWRKYSFDQSFTGGRSYTFIERSPLKKVLNFWQLDPGKTTVKREDGRKFYEHRDGKRLLRYEASEIIDMPFMLKPDGLNHRSPIMANKDIVGLAQAVTKYGSKFFQNGGVPPFVITGPMNSAGAIQRAGDDLTEAVKSAAKESRLALALPNGHDIKPLGVDPEKSQLVEAQRFVIEQVARIYSLPPVFLQDLTHGTLTNTEQQDLMLTKHTLTRWIKQFEQELNLKLFGRGNGRLYVEFNVDGLLRGDFKTRMEGYARAITTGQMTPDEAREKENRPTMGGPASKLHMQGAMLPIEKLGVQKSAVPPLADKEDPLSEDDKDAA